MVDNAVNNDDDDDDDKLVHGRDKDEMMDAEPESDSDSNSDNDAIRPPPDLLQRARDILGRPVSLKDVMRAWDRSSNEHTTTVEARTDAALERLLLFEEDEADSNRAQARPQPHQQAQRVNDGGPTAPGNSNSKGKGKAKAKAPAAANNIIELSDSDGDYRDGSDSGDDEVEVVSGGKAQNKARVSTNKENNSKGKGRAEAQDARDTSRSDKGKGRISESSKRKREPDHDGDSDSDGSLPPSPYKQKPKPHHPVSPSAGSGESSSGAQQAKTEKERESDSSADSLLAESRHKLRDASSPPTPPLGGASSSASSSAFVPGAASTSKLAPAPKPNKEEEPLSPLVQVLAMVPNVCPDHAASLIEQYSAHPNCVEHVIDSLFSAASYPKAKAQTGGEDGVGSGSGAGKGKGKGRADMSDEEKDKALEARYTNIQARAQPAPEYFEAVFDLLEGEFPSVPIPHIRKTLGAHGYFYTPTVYALQADAAASPAGYKALLKARKSKGAASRTVSVCAELEEERAWLVSKTARADALEAARRAEEAREAEEEAAGLVVECGCCFGDSVWGKIVQCPEAHLFCMECARKNAENAMGNRQTEIRCMDQDGCTAEFTRSELERFLKTNQLLLLDKLRSESALDAAQLAGLSRCPYCPFAGIIDNPDEKLLRCENEECLRVTCRACQKPDHLPKSCAEYEADLKANSIHKVEEAMTAALVRKCPKCQQNYVKEYGCNKITCSNASCRALSCYMCMEIIRGYDHFSGQAAVDAQGRPTGRMTMSKCVLWDHNEGTNEHARIEAARLAAVNELKSTAQEQGQEVADQEALDKLKLGKPAQAGYVPHPAHRVHAYPHNVPGGAGAAGAAAAVAAQQAAAGVPRQYDHLMQAHRDLQALMNQMPGHAYNPYLNAAAAAAAPAAVAPPVQRVARPPAAPRKRRR